MRDFGDHAAHGRSVVDRRAPTDAVETKAEQRLTLRARAADRTADLLDRDFLCCHDASPAQPSTASASAPPIWRRACNVETLRLRRAATERGESSRVSA